MRVFEAPGNFIGNLSRIARLNLKQVHTRTTLGSLVPRPLPSPPSSRERGGAWGRGYTLCVMVSYGGGGSQSSPPPPITFLSSSSHYLPLLLLPLPSRLQVLSPWVQVCQVWASQTRPSSQVLLQYMILWNCDSCVLRPCPIT